MSVILIILGTLYREVSTLKVQLKFDKSNLCRVRSSSPCGDGVVCDTTTVAAVHCGDAQPQFILTQFALE